MQISKSASKANNDEPGWAPLRDSYMVSNSKLKDWDKMPASVRIKSYIELYFNCCPPED